MRIRAQLGICILLLGMALNASAILPLFDPKPSLSPFKLVSATTIGFPPMLDEWVRTWDKTYRMGDEWGKKKVTIGELEKKSPFQRAAMATGSVSGGTAFYLGKYNGFHVVATNHHVMDKEDG